MTRTNRGHIKGQPMRTLFRHGRPKALNLRFWEKVNKNGPTVRPELGPCWLWTGSTDGRYGQLWDGEKLVRATHVVIFLETGHWPAAEVLHKCDNVTCVRYAHIRESTHQENMEDMAKKDRGTAKLTTTEVIALRQAYATGSFSQVELGEKYAIADSTVSRIINRVRRRHIPLEEKK